jgi:uncharacterized membrane protein YhiD involved in acid resistance
MNGIAFALQLAMALLFGAAIGAERQWRQHTAGLRTNALVSSGAAMFVLGGRLMGRRPTASCGWRRKSCPASGSWAEA